MSLTATPSAEWVVIVVGLAATGAILSAGLIVVLRSVLVRYALARPSARGLHRIPTPQGGGIAVLAACAFVAATAAWLSGIDRAAGREIFGVLLAAAGLGALGLIDDIRPLPALPRLLLQLAAMAVGLACLPEGSRVLPQVPILCERILLVLGGTWLINLTNFMDGMDWITVVDTMPLTLWLTGAALVGVLPVPAGVLSLGLFAGLAGFAPFNRPVARLFLGDVGSLPIGFLQAYALFSLAAAGHWVAALILPLYPVADSTLTLMWRLLRRQRVWEPHRNHFYQTAIARGLTVWRALSYVGVTNLLLVMLACVSVNAPLVQQFAALGAAALLVTGTHLLLARGARGPLPT